MYVGFKNLYFKDIGYYILKDIGNNYVGMKDFVFLRYKKEGEVDNLWIWKLG